MNRPLTIHPAGIFDVRPMLPSEAERVEAMFVEVVDGLGYYNDDAQASEIAKHRASELLAFVGDDPGAVLVASTGSELAGFVISRDDDGPMWLSWFGVRAAYRGSGVSRLLLAALERRAETAGSHKIWCDSRTTNEPSAECLSKDGYRRICTIADHWYRQDFILWEKSVG